MALLPPALRRAGSAILAGDADALYAAAHDVTRWTVVPWLLQAGWAGGVLQIAGTVELTDEAEGSDSAPAHPLAERRFAAALPDEDAASIAGGFATASVQIDVRQRGTAVRWDVPVVVHRSGLRAGFTADLDPQTLAGGTPLPEGVWDVSVRMDVMGVAGRRRLVLTEERQPGHEIPGRADQSGEPAVVAYFTRGVGSLALDVGLTKHARLRKPAPDAGPNGHEATKSSAPLAQAAPLPDAQCANCAASRPDSVHGRYDPIRNDNC